MQSWGLFFGELDEYKVKQLMSIFGLKDYEKAKEIYLDIKSKVSNDKN